MTKQELLELDRMREICRELITALESTRPFIDCNCGARKEADLTLPTHTCRRGNIERLIAKASA